ncbi:MAG: hypothetical protein AAB719_00340 [Patescibacteria group bacterium]
MMIKKILLVLFLLIPTMAFAKERMPHPDPEPPPADQPVDVNVGVDVDTDVTTDVAVENNTEATGGGATLVNKHRRNVATAYAPSASAGKCQKVGGLGVQLPVAGLSFGGSRPSDPEDDDSCLYELYEKLVLIGMYKPACMVLMSTRAATYSKINVNELETKPCDNVTGPQLPFDTSQFATKEQLEAIDKRSYERDKRIVEKLSTK